MINRGNLKQRQLLISAATIEIKHKYKVSLLKFITLEQYCLKTKQN
jgi:hypothetical protein